MAAVDQADQAAKAPPAAGLLPLPTELVVLFLGLFGMFSLTLYDLFFSVDAGLWNKDEHSHGPIMLGLSLWLLHQRWREFDGKTDGSASGTWLAWVLFAIGFAFYVPGRALNIIYFEVFAFLPMMIGVVALVGGWPLLNKLKFPLFFLVFMVPIPGFVLDPISHFVKLHISITVAEILWWLGYPISHTGVVLTIGQYQLLVADACAGMRTLFMLEAMGIFYLNVVRHSSLLRNVVLSLLIVPISFVANMLRVLFLALLTYHWGDEVGQGYLHGFAGIVLFVIALVLTISTDGLLRWIASRRAPQAQGATS
ncbi:MAG: exosortase B [Proteobacteria bacterium]|uniref:exosortase B n=1 Tax=Aquabacterium sp. TaxID=1872578 RepID=UPI0035C6EB45|nr:exosortase B [Pseudomonadota bacterium]